MIEEFAIPVGVYIVKHIIIPELKELFMTGGSKQLAQPIPFNIDKLLKSLGSKEDMPAEDATLTISEGTFFPAVLLYSGWWERTKKDANYDNPHLNELQEWLFTGFEEWAPSFDISLEGDGYLMAQLGSSSGSGDEANTIPLIIAPEKAGDIRRRFKRQQEPLNVQVTGRFCRRDKETPTSTADESDYCIVVDNIATHEISISNNKPTFYTGYLWQCLIPEKTLKEANEAGRQPNLEDVYFVWEHANFATKTTLNYGLHGLEQKKLYIEREVDDKLIMLHKSSTLVPGIPLYSPNIFYNQLFK